MSPRESVRYEHRFYGDSCVDPLMGFSFFTVFPSPGDRTDFAARPLSCFHKPQSQELPPKSLAHRHPRVSLPGCGGIVSLETA